MAAAIHRDLVRTEVILLAQPEDLLDHLRISLSRLMMRNARAVLKPLEAFLLVAASPLAVSLQQSSGHQVTDPLCLVFPKDESQVLRERWILCEHHAHVHLVTFQMCFIKRPQGSRRSSRVHCRLNSNVRVDVARQPPKHIGGHISMANY